MNFKFQISNIKYPILGLTLLFIPQVAFAETRTNIDVTTNTGGNTVCVNGECTTSSGTSKSKVCVNGECYESDGDLKVESKNGKTSVNINNESDSSVKVKNSSEAEIVVEAEDSVKGTSSSASEKENIENDVDISDDKSFSFVEFVKNQFSKLRKIITFQFLFGDK